MIQFDGYFSDGLAKNHQLDHLPTHDSDCVMEENPAPPGMYRTHKNPVNEIGYLSIGAVFLPSRVVCVSHYIYIYLFFIIIES